MGNIKDIYDLIKEAMNIAKRLGEAELITKVNDIQVYFFNLKEEMQKIKEKNFCLEQNLRELENIKNLENDLALQKGGFYVKKSENNGNFRYCGRCFSVSKNAVPLIDMGDGTLFCPNCKNYYYIE